MNAQIVERNQILYVNVCKLYIVRPFVKNSIDLSILINAKNINQIWNKEIKSNKFAVLPSKESSIQTADGD